MALLDIVSRELIRQECESRSIAPSEKDIASAKRRFLSDILSPRSNFEEFAASLPKDERDSLIRQITIDASAEVLLKACATNDYTRVSAQEVSNRVEVILNSQVEAELRNSQSRTNAAAAKAAILAGATFYDVTTNRAEIFKDEGRFWDVVALRDIDPDSDLFNFLATAKAGDISDPLDFDDGIGIVGVLLKEKEEEDPEGAAPVDQYTLVRCMFNGYEPIDEPTDFESVRKLLIDRKREEAQKALMSDLFKKAKIEFPYGEKLFAKQKNARGGKAKAKNPKRKKKTT